MSDLANCHFVTFNRMSAESRAILKDAFGERYTETKQLTGGPGANIIAPSSELFFRISDQIVIYGVIVSTWRILHFSELKHYQLLVHDECFDEFEGIAKRTRACRIKDHVWLGERLLCDVMLHEYSVFDYPMGFDYSCW